MVESSNLSGNTQNQLNFLGAQRAQTTAPVRRLLGPNKHCTFTLVYSSDIDVILFFLSFCTQIFNHNVKVSYIFLHNLSFSVVNKNLNVV